MFELSPTVEVPASSPGAVPGWEATCSCGTVIRSSLRTLIELERGEHAAWHERKGDAPDEACPFCRGTGGLGSYNDCAACGGNGVI